jgi:hypothetical protein
MMDLRDSFTPPTSKAGLSAPSLTGINRHQQEERQRLQPSFGLPPES